MDPELQAILDRLLADPTAEGHEAVTDDDLAGLSDAELGSLRDGILAAADDLAGADRTPETVAAIVRAADAVERVGALEDSRCAEAAQRDQDAQAALDRVQARRPQAVTPDPEGGEDEDTDAPDTETAPTPQAVAASGRRAPIGAVARQRATGGAQVRDRAPAAPARRPDPTPLVAAASAPGHAPGAKFGSIYDLAEAFNEKTRLLGRSTRRSGPSEPVLVASASRAYQTDRFLRRDDEAGNTRKLDTVTAPEAVGRDAAGQPALIAAGGFCAPAEVDYSVDVLGVTDRPVRDALANFGADRGRISFRKNLAFADYAGAASVWTEDDDIAAADPEEETPPSKPCIDIECPATSDAEVAAHPLCLNFRNLTSRFDPEGTAAAIRAANIAYARFSENRLLGQLRSYAIDVTAPATGLGALRDLFAAFEHLFAYAESRWRITGVRMRAAIPTWVVRLISLDQARGMHGGNLELLSITADQINTWLRGHGVEPVWHLDGMASQSASAGVPAVAQQYYGALTDAAAVPGFPDNASIVCWYEGDVSYLDGGTLDLGVIRDSGLVASNAYRTFMEEFWGTAFRGQEMYHLVATLQPRGGQAGTVDTSAFTD